MASKRWLKAIWVAVVVMLAVTLAAGGAFAKGKPPKDKITPPIFQPNPQGTPAQPVTPGGRPLYARLSGASVVPGPGDPDGSGTVKLRLNQGQGSICFEIRVQKISTPTAVKIYTGTAGNAGLPVATLSNPVNGLAIGCTTASKDLVKAIRMSPAGYYLSVVTSGYPSGALRGQLSKFP